MNYSFNIESNLICPVCHQIARVPTLTNQKDCDHCFCENCIASISNKCPKDNLPFTSYFKAAELITIMTQCYTDCILCKETLNLLNYTEHFSITHTNFNYLLPSMVRIDKNIEDIKSDYFAMKESINMHLKSLMS